MWTAAGRPRSGDVFNHKKNTKYKYKLAIKDAAVQFEGRFDDELLSNYLRKKISIVFGKHGRIRCKRSIRTF